MDVRDKTLYGKIEQAMWDVEIGLDSLRCDDVGEGEEVAVEAERLLHDATILRRRLIRGLGGRPEGR